MLDGSQTMKALNNKPMHEADEDEVGQDMCSFENLAGRKDKKRQKAVDEWLKEKGETNKVTVGVIDESIAAERENEEEQKETLALLCQMFEDFKIDTHFSDLLLSSNSFKGCAKCSVGTRSETAFKKICLLDDDEQCMFDDACQ